MTAKQVLLQLTIGIVGTVISFVIVDALQRRRLQQAPAPRQDQA